MGTKQFEYNVFDRDGRDASSKAKKDVSEILKKRGCHKLYNPSKYRPVRIIQQFFAILFLPNDSTIYVQHYSIYHFFYKVLNLKKSIKKIAIIHDMESLRKEMSVSEEIGLLNCFDYIVSHNKRMTEYLKENNVKAKIVDLQIFDYLLDDAISVNKKYDKNTVFYAGNLIKPVFLTQLSKIGTKISFNIYGAEFKGIDRILSQNNVAYKGSFRPEQLIANVEGGWGLVWDGDSLETCSGVTGEYMRYNNPHKVSMCIVSERPIIIWSQAAMAEYIIKNRLGVVVDSLFDLPDILQSISNEDYQQIVQNVRIEKKRLVNGQSLKEALDNLLM